MTLVLSAVPAGAVYAPDATFDSDGAVLIDKTNPEQGVGVATRSGLTYVAFTGSTNRISVARLLLNGSPDTSWSGDGFVTTPLYTGGTKVDIVVQSSGKVLVTGQGAIGSSQGLRVVRLTAAGSLDKTFSGDGQAFATATNVYGGQEIATDSSGRIYVVGRRESSSGPGDLKTDIAAARFTSSGSRDNTFSGDGVAFVSQSTVDSLGDAAVDASNRLVVMGSAWTGVFQMQGGRGFVARLRTSGALDTAFSSDGKATFTFGASGPADSVTGLGGGVDSSNRPVIAVTNLRGQIGGVRFTSAGALDSSYSGDGRAFAPFASAMSISSAKRVGDKLVFVGWGGTENLWVGRMTSTGAADTSFGVDGEILFDATAHDSDTGNVVAGGPSGSVVTAGTAATIGPGTDVLVTRLAG
jgi:uncharacterized delta-60 repeat protein